MPDCLNCGSSDASFYAKGADEEYCTTDDTFEYFRCAGCGVLFIEPVPSDRLSEIYPSNYYSFDQEVTRSVLFMLKDWLDRRFYSKILAELPHEKLNVLDVGGGEGSQAVSLKKADFRVVTTTVVDLDSAAAEIAKRNGNRFHCCKFEEFQTEETYEVILMLNLIEHVEDPGGVLRKAAQCLAPGGIILVKTPNTDSLDARLFKDSNWGGYHCPRHWVLFDAENIKSKVLDCGLVTSELRYTQGAPFWATSVLFKLARTGLIRLSAEKPAPKHFLYPILLLLFAGFDIARSRFSKTSQMFLVIEAE